MNGIECSSKGLVLNLSLLGFVADFDFVAIIPQLFIESESKLSQFVSFLAGLVRNRQCGKLQRDGFVGDSDIPSLLVMP